MTTAEWERKRRMVIAGFEAIIDFTKNMPEATELRTATAPVLDLIRTCPVSVFIDTWSTYKDTPPFSIIESVSELSKEQVRAQLKLMGYEPGRAS